MLATRSIMAAAIAACLAVSAACAKNQEALGEASLTRITFLQTTDPNGDDQRTRQIEVVVAHQDEEVEAMRFTTRADGSVIEERHWEADSAATIVVRTWPDCAQFNEVMPPPAPDTLEGVLEELFGPREIPADAETTSDGARRWSMGSGIAIITVTDRGGDYPDRIITIGGDDGEIGTMLETGTVEQVTDSPGWEPGWESCIPVRG